MCGILGQFNFQQENISRIDLQAGLNCIAHRGPDNTGIFEEKNVTLAHVRLSVIDISSDANQPFLDDSRQHALIFNGEIYNYVTLRDELKNLGHEFYTTSDTEVLLKLIIQFGTEALQKLNGFYSIAYVDLKNNSGFIARDQMGIKPLFYFETECGLTFASGAKSIKKALKNQSFDIDDEAVGQYLRFNYIPAPKSVYSEIKKLRPGTYLKFDSQGLSDHLEIPMTLKGIKKGEISLESELFALLEDSVTLRLQSDVPVGCFLSGGIDSSIIAALASRNKPNLKTFSIGFPEARIFDESEQAESLAQNLKTDHKTILITEEELIQSIDGLIQSLDEPFADSSAIAVYSLCKAVKKDVTVALSGDGADELFGGYNKHRALYLSQNQSFKIRTLRLLSPIIPQLGNRESSINNRLRQLSKFNDGIKLDPNTRYMNWASFSSIKQVQKLLGNTKSSFTPALRSTYKSDFSDFLKMDQELVLANDMLVKVDQMSMANSLEVRVPFLDTRIVEFARKLPTKYLHDGKNGKIILRKAFKGLVPESIFERPKHGFEVPLKRWLSGPLRDEVETYLSPSKVKDFGLFDSETVMNVLKDSRSRHSGDSIYQVWAIYILHKWLEMHG